MISNELDSNTLKERRNRITATISATLGLTKANIIDDSQESESFIEDYPLDFKVLTTQVNEFFDSFKFNNISNYDINKHPFEFVDQIKVLDIITPPRYYPNPRSNEQINNILNIIENIVPLEKPKDCPFNKTKGLIKSLKQLNNSSNPNKEIKKIKKINIDLDNLKKKFSEKCDYCPECLNRFTKSNNEGERFFKLEDTRADEKTSHELYNEIKYLFEYYARCEFWKESHKKCPLYEVKPLWELLEKINEKEVPITQIYYKKIDKEIRRLSKKYKEITTRCKLCKCRDYFENGNDIYSLKVEPPLEPHYKLIHFPGVFLRNNHFINGTKYNKGSILISEDLKKDENNLKLTFVHENSHGLLQDIFDARGCNFNSKKGLNEGFAVAMEYYFADENGLKFNFNRHGEYLSHEILTLPDKKSNLTQLIDALTMDVML